MVEFKKIEHKKLNIMITKINWKRNYFLLLLASMFLFSPISAAEGAHEKGKHYVGPDFGVYRRSIGISGQYDYAVHQNWSVGGMTGFSFRDAKVFFGEEFGGNVGQWLLSVRGSFHFGKFMNLPESLDWYTGINAGVNVGLTKGIGATGHVAMHTGLRYFFPGKNIGLQTDLTAGYELRSITAGAVWRLGNGSSSKSSAEKEKKS